MTAVRVLATGESFDATGVLLQYYLAEARSVGGYTIDGVDYPLLIDESDFDPADYTVAEVEEHLSKSTLKERQRVLVAERAGKARVSLIGERGPELEDLPEGAVSFDLGGQEQVHPGLGEPMTGFEHPADGTFSPGIGSDPEPDAD